MAKVTLTKTLVEKNPQLAELLAERNIEVGSKIEQSELDELYKILETTELKVLTQEHFDAEPALADKGFEVGQVIRVKKKAEVQDLDTSKAGESSQNLDETAKSYIVEADFMDMFDVSIRYKKGDKVPNDFTEDRIQNLLERKLISEA